MGNPYKNVIVNRKQTVQTQPIPNREHEMVKNNAGGYVFQVNDMDYLDRFLILGTEGGTFYQSEKELTEAGAVKVKQLIKSNGVNVVNRIIEVSDKGLAQKNNAAIFGLALAATYGDSQTKKAVKDAIPKVCRTGTHILQLTDFVAKLRGFGRSIREGINSWYLDKNISDLSYQLVKYQSRDGWKHSDVFRLTHPAFPAKTNKEVIGWVMNKGAGENPAKIIEGFELAKKAESAAKLVQIINDYKLPREAVPTQFLNDVAVWEALLENMGMTAILRNLGKMTSVGLLSNKPFDKNTQKVNEILSNAEAIKKGRLHPLGILMGLKTYSSGHGFKGSNTWTPVSSIVNTLDDAFYMAFDTIVPTNKRILYALDVSGSMGGIIDNTNISCAEVTAAMSMALARTEKNHYIMGFAHTFKDLNISSKDKLPEALKKVYDRTFGSTNCALPFTWGSENKVDFDMAVIMTDNETYGGSTHVTQALSKYRNDRGNPDVRLAVCGFTATNFSIADPQDVRQMDFVGLSSDLPLALSNFARLGDKDAETTATKSSSKKGRKRVDD